MSIRPLRKSWCTVPQIIKPCPRTRSKSLLLFLGGMIPKIFPHIWIHTYTYIQKHENRLKLKPMEPGFKQWVSLFFCTCLWERFKPVKKRSKMEISPRTLGGSRGYSIGYNGYNSILGHMGIESLLLKPMNSPQDTGDEHR